MPTWHKEAQCCMMDNARLPPSLLCKDRGKKKSPKKHNSWDAERKASRTPPARPWWASKSLAPAQQESCRAQHLPGWGPGRL